MASSPEHLRRKRCCGITAEELQTFRRNYEFMWAVLGSSPHLAESERGNSGQSARLRSAALLPSRATLFACSREDYIPSHHTIFKIVDFFNANLTPPITPWDFLHDDLSQSTMYKQRGTSRRKEDFIGVYNGYYPASREEYGVFGAILKIYKTGEMLKALLVTTIRTDEAFIDPILREFFARPAPTLNDFKRFQNEYAKNSQFVRQGRRYYYFAGNVEVTDSSVLIVFRNEEGNDFRKRVLTLNTKRLPSERTEPYHGGLAFVLTTADKPFSSRLYPMGLINSLYSFYSLNDERIAKALHLRTNGRDVRLTDKADDVWNDLALAQRG